MVFSLAPKASNRSWFQSSNAAVNTAETISCIVKQLPSVRSADSISPRPMKMEARGAPPLLMSAAKAETIMISGMHTPTPVSAIAPTSGICPM